ncbi:ketopantoate reductase family protein [Coriobacteriales bacterium OH1046]|nr:ketopantoate reductase family protein [Coriobacteriales bacterium OH1046]
MKITVIGCGAMGGLYGAYLSQRNDVTVIDVVKDTVDTINRDGIEIVEPDGSSAVYRPKASLTSEGMEPQDLVIVFVKALFTESALTSNARIIGPDTYLMTLQNGGGHEEILGKFADRDHVVIGTTQHNAARLAAGSVRHGGSGKTVIGASGLPAEKLIPIAETLSSCGLEAAVDGNVQRLIWNKLFTNVSASVLTALFQMPLGFIASDEYAWSLCAKLVRETVDIAAVAGFEFDFEQKLAEVRHVCEASSEGITSIQADIAAGRRTEVDTISGYVADCARKHGIPAPNHEFAVAAIHALEGKARVQHEAAAAKA